MIWRLEYENAHGDVARLDIQRGAATPVEIIEGTENPFLLSYELEDKSKKGFVMSSFADISLYETATFNIDDLKTLDETDISVRWYINSVLEWTGFVVPDFFSRTIGESAIVNLAASDRLSSLKNATLDGLSEYITLIDLAIACLAKTELTLPLNTVVDFKAKSGQSTIDVMDVFAMSERLEDDKGKKISCFDVLRSILVLTNSTIRQRKGRWTIYNKIQHEALTPSLNFDEVYQGAKRTIQPVLASVGAFQEFGGNRELPLNNSFKNNDSNWAKGGSPLFVTNFDNRDFSFASATSPAVFGQATNQNQLINRNVFNSGATSLSGTPYLKSVDIKVPLEDTGTSRGDNVLMTIEINSKSVHQSIAHFAVVRFYDGVVDAYLANNLDWEPFFSTIDINYIQENIRGRGYGVEDITTIETSVGVGRGKDPSKYKIAVYILGVTREGSPTNRMAAIRSVKIIFPESFDFGKGILYRTDQIGNFSKKSNPDTTIFGDFITMGLNGYFYPYRDNDKSALKTVVGSTYSSTTEWTTATDPAAGELPILQHVTRQMSRMFGVAHNVLSAVIDAKTFDPLAIVTNCAGEKYVIVYSVFDFLRSTVEVELQQIAYGSLQRRDFIFSYFGGGDGDGISSIGSVSGGGSSSSGGGGSFLDKYFSFDEANNALVANVNLVSEKEIAAYFADGSIPSIFDNIPPATSESTGGIKASSTYQNGIRINSSGFLEIDPSYADSGVSSWNDLTNRPAWLTPATKTLFEAGHGHTWGQITSKPTSFPPSSHNHPISDITGLQTALNGKLGTGAQAYDSARLGGYSAASYPRKAENASITGLWTINNDLRLGAGTTRNLYTGSMRIRDNGTGAWIVSPESGAPGIWLFRPNGDTSTSNTFSIRDIGVGIGVETATERLHVVGNGLFTGNIYSTGLMKVTHPAPRYEFHQSDVQNACRWVLDDFSMQMQVIEYGTSAYLKTPFIIDINAPSAALKVESNGSVTVGGNLGVTGNLTANNGTFTNNIGIGSGLITYDPINDTIRFNKTVVSDFDIVAFTDSGQSLPSIFDNLPKTSKTSFGVVKVGAGINVSGGVISLDGGAIAPQTLSFNGLDNKLSISGGNTVDLSGLTPDLTGYATENWVQLGFKPIAYQPTWGQITSKPTSFPPSSHNHPISDITGLQTALNGKLGTGAQAYDSARLGGYAPADYARKGQNETITGRWSFLSGEDTELAIKHSVDATAKNRSASLILGRSSSFFLWRMSSQSTLAWGGFPNLHFENKTTDTGAWNKRVTILSDGNVGINNAAPTEKLHVVGNGLFETSNGLIQITPTGWRNPVRASINVVSKGDYPSELNLSHTHSGVVKGWQLSAREGDAGELHFYTHVGSSYMMRASLDTNGNFVATGEVTAYSSSDIRLKKNIKTIESAIDIIEKLNPVQFNWNEKAIELNSAKDSDRVNYGVIAQELEQILPDLVHQTNGYKSVDYPQLFGILIKAIQELNLKIKE